MAERFEWAGSDKFAWAGRRGKEGTLVSTLQLKRARKRGAHVPKSILQAKPDVSRGHPAGPALARALITYPIARPTILTAT